MTGAIGWLVRLNSEATTSRDGLQRVEEEQEEESRVQVEGNDKREKERGAKSVCMYVCEREREREEANGRGKGMSTHLWCKSVGGDISGSGVHTAFKLTGKIVGARMRA